MLQPVVKKVSDHFYSDDRVSGRTGSNCLRTRREKKEASTACYIALQK